MFKPLIKSIFTLTSLCKKTSDTALLSFLKQSFTNVNSLVSKTSKALSFTLSYQRLKMGVFLLTLTTIMLLLATSCSKSSDPTPVGTYTRTEIIDEVLWPINLTFTEDGFLLWEPVDSIPGHVASVVSYRLEGNNQILFYNDTDCNSEATYGFFLNGATLNLLAVVEECLPRELALSGDWERIP